MRRASNYWIVTVGANARPHARPVDGVWVDGALCFGGSPQTRWVRNLMANPRSPSISRARPRRSSSKGTAEYVTDPAHPLAVPSTATSKAKYPQYFSGTEPPFRPFWALRPATAFAWTLEASRGARRAGASKRADRSAQGISRSKTMNGERRAASRAFLMSGSPAPAPWRSRVSKNPT